MSESDDFTMSIVDTNRLGKPTVLNGLVVWSPPRDLDDLQIELVKNALQYFNEGLVQRKFEVEITETGEVKDEESRAQFSKRWWGFEVKLNHAEACGWTAAIGGGQDVKAIATALVGIAGSAWFTGPVGAAVASIIVTCSSYIRSMNVLSGGEGVTLKFLWPAVYAGCKRRGKGASPCG